LKAKAPELPTQKKVVILNAVKDARISPLLVLTSGGYIGRYPEKGRDPERS
jgi:hypothetical protein